MKKASFRWRELALILLAASLAWGLRGQHGHEKGAALAGAMIGLSLAAATGGGAWIGAAVSGSLCFAIGGALSYGRFMEPAFHGSWEAIGTLGLTGLAWGGLGGLGLGLGLTLSRYRRWEKICLSVGLFMVWFLVDRLFWGRMSGPNDLKTRELMAEILAGVWAFLCLYVGLLRRDGASLRMALAGGVGFGIGFPLAAWLQGWGPSTGIPIDWWKAAEHLIGLCGGISLGAAALSLERFWRLPRPVGPLERWLAVAWLLWFLPGWILFNDIDYWISELTLLPVWVSKAGWLLVLTVLLALAAWGWLEMRRGRLFVTSWMPRHLRSLFLVFLWTVTLISSGKTLFTPASNPTPVIFLIMALGVTLLVQINRPKPVS